MEAITYTSDDEPTPDRKRDSSTEEQDCKFSNPQHSDANTEECKTTNYAAKNLELVRDKNDLEASQEKGNKGSGHHVIRSVVNDGGEDSPPDSEKKVQEAKTGISVEGDRKLLAPKCEETDIDRSAENEDKEADETGGDKNDNVNRRTPNTELNAAAFAAKKEEKERVEVDLLRSDDDDGNDDDDDDDSEGDQKFGQKEIEGGNSFNGIQIVDVEDSDNSNDNAKEECSDVECNKDEACDTGDTESNESSRNEKHLANAEDREIVTISDEESLNNRREENIASAQANHKTDLIIDLDDDDDDDETEEEIICKSQNADEIGVESNAADNDECAAEANEPKQKAIIDIEVKCDEVQAVATDGGTLSDEAEEDAQRNAKMVEAQELLNGRGDNSDEEFKMQIDEDDSHSRDSMSSNTNEEGNENGLGMADRPRRTNEAQAQTNDGSPLYSQHHLIDDPTNSLSSEEAVIKVISCELPAKKEPCNDTSPKVNGEHGAAALPEPLHCEMDAGNEDEPASDSMQHSRDFEIVQAQEKEVEGYNHFGASINKSLVASTMRLDESDDECTRFSMSSSTSLSSTTSSSHQLVIDHPLEDGSDTAVPLSTDKRVLQPVKFSLKRKLSNLSPSPPETAPHSKLPHLALAACSRDDKAEEQEVGKLSFNTFNGGESCKEEDDNSSVKAYLETSEHPDADHAKEVVNETKAAEPSGEMLSISTPEFVAVSAGTTKLEIAEPFSEGGSPEVNSSPLLNSLLLRKLPQLEEKTATSCDGANRTRFFCFNCKTDSFETLANLNEHQRICLANKSLLPAAFVNAGTKASSRTDALAVLAKSDDNVHVVNERTARAGEELHEPCQKSYYKCSSCSTVHENWNLFVHIREMHKRLMCLYCLRMFPSAEKLSLHLEIKHDLEQDHYNSEEALRGNVERHVPESTDEVRLLMCCTCEHIFLEHDHFSDHVCTEFMQACVQCGQKGRHTNQCKEQNEGKRSRVKKKPKTKEVTSASSTFSKSKSSATSQSKMVSKSPLMKAPLSSDRSLLAPCVYNTPHQFNNQHQQQIPAALNVNQSMAILDGSCKSLSPSPNSFRILNARDCLIQRANVAPSPLLQSDPRELPDLITKPVEHKQPLTVPKFKLRVPKEFQKSVDAAISSSESEEDEEVPLNDDSAETNPAIMMRSSSSSALLTEGMLRELAAGQLTELQCTQTALNKQLPLNEDDDSLDETNSNLVRILQEIERTKQDIKRTKETLHAASSKSVLDTPRPSTVKAAPLTGKIAQQNWSPTPPASPNTQCASATGRMALMSQGETGLEHKKVVNQQTTEPPAPTCRTDDEQRPFIAPPPPSPMNKERRNTTGSDVDMDIDETISGQPTQCIPERSDSNSESRLQETSVDKITESADAQQNPNNVANPRDADDFNISNNALKKVHHEPEEVTKEVENAPSQEEHPLEPEHRTAAHEKDPASAEQRPTSMENHMNEDEDLAEPLEQAPTSPPDGIAVADEEIITTELQLDRPLEKFEVVEFVRICLKAVYPLCLYCNHARRIAVNGRSLVLHLIAQHRFSATVDSITAEELKPSTIVAKLKSYLPALEDHFLNSNSYCTLGEGAFTHHFNERIFECFQCRFVASTHKELYLHNRKMHLRTAILCFMCRSNFFSFCEILCHVCPGEPHKISVFDVKFRCCLCDVDNIPSPFRLMVHLRKKHFACDVCLEDCRDQGRLSSHVWKHKLHHLCYRCGIAYRNKMDITKHLFWKHGTESIICKRCLQKRWRHVYHFCIPPSNFVCDICNLCFSRATYLKVHKRTHAGDLRYPCTDENCDQKFISRRLLLKHTTEHQLQDSLAVQPKICEAVAKESTETPQGNFVAAEQQNEVTESATDDNNKSPLKTQTDRTEPTLAGGKVEPSAVKTSPEATDSKLKAQASTAGTCSKQRKKKKSKRSKESLEDLNLIAPNLSESDSSDESEADNKSKSEDDSLVPRVMLSPPSEAEQDKDEDKNSAKNKAVADPKVLDIWKNFLEAQGNDAAAVAVEQKAEESDYTEDHYPTPQKLHVAQSDHDYCSMVQPEKPKSLAANATPTKASLAKRKTSKSPRRNAAAHRSDASSASSSGSSGSDSDSSCSCGSNCSCSSSNSDSSSSSSSSNDTDSSAASRTSRKRHRKKSDRDRGHKKSASSSPLKKHRREENARNHKTPAANISALANEAEQNAPPRSPTPPKEPLFNESDLETAESDTDEEFYDEHPQKFANELLAQKRAQLMAQTRLSPSHNYDIVENSRPSTPSLPEEVAREKKVRLKKKKRDRKSANRSVVNASAMSLLKFDTNAAAMLNATLAGVPNEDLQLRVPTTSKVNSLPPNAAPIIPNSLALQRHDKHQPHSALAHAAVLQLTPRPAGLHNVERMSEGSSCSDADGSLKRSKRARRPNKFYGYTSDEEHNLSGLGQPLMIGMRAIKPQPPPQLTWRKEDLPTPSKSVLNNHKHKTSRTPKTPSAALNAMSGLGSTKQTPSESTSSKKKRAALGDGTLNRKRNSNSSSELPRIPTLKIRPSQIGLTHAHTQLGGINHIPATQSFSSHKEIGDGGDDDDDDDEEPESSETSSNDDDSRQLLLDATLANSSGTSKLWEAALQQSATPGPKPSQIPSAAALVLPTVAPAPPQTTVFNQKIPPALLPNPDFATLQYFKANNIRYPIRPPAGARHAREGESVYCYCRCPYDEVSEMIACDGESCLIEWFHFECVGIMVAPQGKWFCAECRPKYSEELYPASTA